MKKTILAISLSCATLLSTQVMAELTIPGMEDLVINLGSNDYDATGTLLGSTVYAGANDSDSLTGLFDDFAFDTLWATSVYDFSDGIVGPSFYDTNIESELIAAGANDTTGYTLTQLAYIATLDPLNAADAAEIAAIVPAGSLSLPDSTQDVIKTLSPITDTSLPTSPGKDDEGYGTTWIFTTEFHVDGLLVNGEPDYTDGWFTLNFVDLIDDSNNIDDVLMAEFSSDTVVVNDETASVELYFDIVSAASDFFYIWGTGSDATDTSTMTDLSTLIPDPLSDDASPVFRLAFLVDPAEPTSDELVATGWNGTGYDNAIRQTTMRGGGQLPNAVSEPSTIAAFGLALLGLAGMSRRRRS